MTAYEMRIRDWSSDVCSSDLRQRAVDILQPLRLPVEAAVDPPRQFGPVARVAQRVEFAPPPEPQRHKHRSIRLFGKLGMVDEIQAKVAARIGILGQASDLDQTAPGVQAADAPSARHHNGTPLIASLPGGRSAEKR